MSGAEEPDLAEPFREIYDSGSGLAGRLALSLGGALFGVLLLAVGLPPDVDPLLIAAGCAAMVPGCYFGSGLIYRALTMAVPIAVIDTTGLVDRRISRQMIRWSDVLLVRRVRSRYGIRRGARLVMNRSTLDQLSLRGLRRWFSRDGVSVLAGGTQVDGEQLYSWCLAYSRTHKFEVEKQNV